MVIIYVIGFFNFGGYFIFVGSYFFSLSNIVGVYYKVGKKIGEGFFGVIFEG